MRTDTTHSLASAPLLAGGPFLLALLTLLGAPPALAGPGPAEGPPPIERPPSADELRAHRSPHQLDWDQHRGVRHRPLPLPGPLDGPWAPWLLLDTPAVDRPVYGWFPYWASDQAFAELRWELLTHVAYFSVVIDAQGAITDRRGWPDAGFVQTAHLHGVRAELGVTLFDGGDVLALCQSAPRRAAAVRNLVAEVRAGGADGVAIDFEGLVAGTRDHLSTFIEELRAGFDAAGLPDASITIAGPAVDWSANFDLPRLLQSIDLYFLMAYDFHWSGSANAGPVGQLRVGPVWTPEQTQSAWRALAVNSKGLTPEQRSRIVCGVPYYGRAWRTETEAVNAPTVGFLQNYTYSAMQDLLAGGLARRWEPESSNPWLLRRDGAAIHQIWYDDAESLAAKYQLAREQGVGVGMWALGNDVGRGELWDLLEDQFTGEQAPPAAGTADNPLPIAAFPFDDQRDTTRAPGNRFNYYSPCAPDTHEYGREWVYAFETCRPGALTATVTDGAGVDVDLQLLDAPEQGHCLGRHDATLAANVAPGRYWLTVDTFVSSQIEQPGAYSLHVTFTPQAGSVGCDADERCVAGVCEPVCAPPLSPCAGRCVDLRSSDGDCGVCGRSCAGYQRCLGGQCEGEPPPTDAGTPEDSGTPPDDLGSPTPDSGPVGADSGTPADAGEEPEQDSGHADSGAPPDPDGGTAADAGEEPGTDLGGPAPADAGRDPADAQTSPDANPGGQPPRTATGPVDSSLSCECAQAPTGAPRRGAQPLGLLAGLAGGLLLLRRRRGPTTEGRSPRRRGEPAPGAVRARTD